MTLRQLCASTCKLPCFQRSNCKRISGFLAATAHSYALVRFDVDDCISIVPAKRVRGDVLNVGAQYDVEWTGKEVFCAKLLAVGESIN